MTFKRYHRITQVIEMEPWHPGYDMTGISISALDKNAGSPKPGDMISRNPKNTDDKWLVSAEYFSENFEHIRANARLIASAPELLKALIDVLPYAQAAVGLPEPSWPTDSVILKARAAIAKATGITD